jgi:glycosyltransferase involved in cell wall biosynthesis
MSQGTAVFTIVSKNYLPYARTLMAAVAEMHPEWDRFVLLVDRAGSYLNPLNERFQLVEVEELPIPDKHKMFFRYNILELNTAAKPWFFDWLFNQKQYRQVVYFDPDILLYSRLDELAPRFADGALAVLTPHLTGRLRDQKRPGEHDVLVSGTYNLGFLALARHPQLQLLLEYWCEKSISDFAVDLSRGLFTDQKWMDLVPGMFPDVHILRHEGYNVAYWNLAHRQLQVRGGRHFVNGRPLVFFHFSGVDPDNPEPLSKHQNRYVLGDLPVVAELTRHYCRLLRESGFEVCRKWPYVYDRLADGSAILPELRALYRRDAALQEAAGPDPFQRPPSFFNSVWNDGVPPITYLMRAIYEARPDVRAAFPDILGANREQFAFWFINSAKHEHRLPSVHTDALESWFRHRPIPRAPANGAAGVPERLFGRARRLADSVARFARTRFEPAALPPPSAAPPSPPRPRSGFASMTGFHPRCPEDVAGGVAWMSRRATVHLPPGAELRVAGEHQAELHRQANGSADVELSCDIDGRPLGQWRLRRSTRFEERLALPPGGGLLGITASSAVIPARAGINSDIRELSVKLSRISVDGRAVVDFSGEDPCYLAADPPLQGVAVVGHFGVPTGVGQLARVYSDSCQAAGIPITRVDFGAARKDFGDHPVVLTCSNLDQLPIVCQYLGEEPYRGRYKIAVSAWELEELPDSELQAFNFLDEIWAPSRFIAEAFGARSPIPVVHIPCATAFELDGRIGKRELGLPEGELLFLCMYDIRSFQERKNPRGAIEAFRRAFPDGGPRLVVKVNHSADGPADMAELRALLKDVPGALLLDRTLSVDEVHALEACCDVYISLHRSEGWGFNPQEAMFLGKPVVATAWSGTLDFMNPRNSCLVDYQLIRLDRDHGPYRRGQRWADPDLEQAAAYLRRLADDSAYRREIGERARATIVEEFSPRVIGERIRQRLQLIARLR